MQMKELELYTTTWRNNLTNILLSKRSQTPRKKMHSMCDSMCISSKAGKTEL